VIGAEWILSLSHLFLPLSLKQERGRGKGTMIKGIRRVYNPINPDALFGEPVFGEGNSVGWGGNLDPPTAGIPFNPLLSHACERSRKERARRRKADGFPSSRPNSFLLSFPHEGFRSPKRPLGK
jgi:hypothetical protein